MMGLNKVTFNYNIHKHLLRNSLLGLGFIFVALAVGMWGCQYYEQMTVIDSFINASMILSGMGPVLPFKTYGGKLFAGCYALFSGLAFIGIVVLIFSPVVRVFFRKIHLDVTDGR